MGDRKYFGTDGIRGTVGQFPITPEFVLKLGWAAGKVLAGTSNGKRKKIVIGKDTRISGYMFESVLEAGLTAAGVDSFLVGPMPTPAIAYLTRTFRADAGIVISASHNPYHDNGIKFFSADGTKLPDEVELAIEAMIDQEMETLPSDKLGKAYRIEDAAARYIEFCKASVPNDFSLRGKHIVLDCANGANYKIGPYVFKELGAKVTKLATQPDGLNINYECGATHLKPLSEKVVELGADLGIAFDGDGDRVMMVDHVGNVVNGDQLIYIIAKSLHEKDQMQGGVAGTLMTNMAIENAFKDMNVPFVRSKVGDRYVMADLKANQWNLGGESSGHVISLQHNSTGDAIIAALQVLKALETSNTTLHEFAAKAELYPQELINIRVKNAKESLGNNQLKQMVSQKEQELNGSGRILIRASGTEPLIRVMVEARKHDVAQQIAKTLADIIEQSQS